MVFLSDKHVASHMRAFNLMWAFFGIMTNGLRLHKFYFHCPILMPKISVESITIICLAFDECSSQYENKCETEAKLR